MTIEAQPIAVRASARRRRREPWPFALAGALGAMVVVLGAFLGIAITHPDSVLVEDSFAASARYDAAVRASDRAAASGSSLDLALEPTAGGVRARLTLRDAGGAAIAVERVRVRRERPAEAGLDAEIEATRDGDGWTALVPLPRPGRWVVEAHAERGDEALIRRIPVEGAP
jgi:nitrogen fixation protein FixH